MEPKPDFFLPMYGDDDRQALCAILKTFSERHDVPMPLKGRAVSLWSRCMDDRNRAAPKEVGKAEAPKE